MWPAQAAVVTTMFVAWLVWSRNRGCVLGTACTQVWWMVVVAPDSPGFSFFPGHRSSLHRSGKSEAASLCSCVCLFVPAIVGARNVSSPSPSTAVSLGSHV